MRHVRRNDVEIEQQMGMKSVMIERIMGKMDQHAQKSVNE